MRSLAISGESWDCEPDDGSEEMSRDVMKIIVCPCRKQLGNEMVNAFF